MLKRFWEKVCGCVAVRSILVTAKKNRQQMFDLIIRESGVDTLLHGRKRPLLPNCRDLAICIDANDFRTVIQFRHAESYVASMSGDCLEDHTGDTHDRLLRATVFGRCRFRCSGKHLGGLKAQHTSGISGPIPAHGNRFPVLHSDTHLASQAALFASPVHPLEAFGPNVAQSHLCGRSNHLGGGNGRRPLQEVPLRDGCSSLHSTPITYSGRWFLSGTSDPVAWQFCG